MKNKLLLYLILTIGYSSNTAYCSEKDNYIVTKNNDTLYFDRIEIMYYKRAVCYKSNGKKVRYSARNLSAVNTNGDIYESGRIVPLAIGWKKYLLLYRQPEDVKNQTIILYSYSGSSGGSMRDENGVSDGYIVTTTAIRNKNDVRGDFRKLSINVRSKILKSCPDCSQECNDIIMNTPINDIDDVDDIIHIVNKKCSN